MGRLTMRHPFSRPSVHRFLLAAPGRLCAAGLAAGRSRGRTAAQPAVPGQGELLVDPDVTANQPRISPKQAIAIADRLPQVRQSAGGTPTCAPDSVTLFKASGNWGINYLSGRDKLADVTIDGRTGEVVEVWTGTQADWVMARGHKGYFGDKFDAWYIWIPMCLLFVAPFFDPRRPFRMLHLDLLVLIGGFGVSHWFFNQGEIGTSVWLVYPVFAYLLARMLYAGLRPRRAAPAAGAACTGRRCWWRESCCSAVSASASSWRPARSATSATEALSARRASWTARRSTRTAASTTSTSTPTGRSTTSPTCRSSRPSRPRNRRSRRPDDYELPAARAATIAFDLLTIVGLFVLGLRLRKGRAGRVLGIALAYAWVALPLHDVPADEQHERHAGLGAAGVGAGGALVTARPRGAARRLPAAAKFAPLALVPLFASGRGEGSEHGLAGRIRPWTMFTAAFGLVVLLSVLPFVPDDGGLKVFYDQTIGFQFSRESPFSIWGQNPGLDPILSVIKLGVLALGVWVAFKPRTPRRLPGRGARSRRPDGPAVHRDPLVLPLHRVVRALRAGRAVRRVPHRHTSRARSRRSSDARRCSPVERELEPAASSPSGQPAPARYAQSSTMPLPKRRSSSSPAGSGHRRRSHGVPPPTTMRRDAPGGTRRPVRP